MTAVTIVISLDSDLVERVDALAQALDLPRSRVLAHAVEEYLRRRRENQRLLARLDEVYGEEPSRADEEARERRRAQHRRISRNASGDQAIRAVEDHGC